VERSWLFSVLGLAGFLVGAWALITYGLPVVMPFVVALLIAELINPPISWLARRLRIPRGLSTAVVLVLVVGVIVTLLTVGIAYLVSEIRTLIAHLPYWYAVMADLANQLFHQAEALLGNLPTSVQDQVNAGLGRLQQSLASALNDLASLLGLVVTLPGVLFNVMIAFIATFFIARDREQIGSFVLSLFPKQWRVQLRQVKTEVWTNAIGWAKAQLLLIIMTTIISMTGLAIIGSNYVLLAGLAIGMMDVLPILGPGGIYVPWAVYAAFSGNLFFAVKLLILYGVTSAVRQALESKLIGDRVGLHPLAVLLSIFLGIRFFGALGVLFGPLITILLKAMITSGLLPIFPDQSRV